jgi:hypothetical protein
MNILWLLIAHCSLLIALYGAPSKFTARYHFLSGLALLRFSLSHRDSEGRLLSAEQYMQEIILEGDITGQLAVILTKHHRVIQRKIAEPVAWHAGVQGGPTQQ